MIDFMRGDIIVGLDIGTRSVRMAAGQVVMTGGREQLHILGAVEVPSEGMKKGVVLNVEDVVSGISMCRERLERLIGMPVENVYTSINGSRILCQESRGLVGILKPNGEIDEEDKSRALEQAQTIIVPPNYEILHVIEKGYSVDGQPNIKDPVGMTGIRLEVNALLIETPLTNLKNLTKCIFRAGININDIVLGIISDTELVLTSRQKDVGAIVINIGAATTGVAVYEEGELVHVAILPIGSDYITQDINLVFKTSYLEVAEKLKVRHGSASSRNISKKDEIDISAEDDGGAEAISRKALADIIEARVEEIFSKVNSELKKINRIGLLPAGAILCGGGAKLEGIIEVAKRELKLPATVGYPIDVSSVSEKINDPAFITALGLIKWGSERQGVPKDVLQGIFSTIKRWFDVVVSKTGDSLKIIFK